MQNTTSNIWPTILTKDVLPSFNDSGGLDCMSNNATVWGWCPAREWSSVYEWVNNYQNQQFAPNITIIKDSREVRYLTSAKDIILGDSIGWAVSSIVDVK